MGVIRQAHELGYRSRMSGVVATTPEGSPSGVYRATRDFAVTNGVQRSLLSVGCTFPIFSPPY